MNREQILTILYEMALVIGGEVRLRPLLSKTLQRLLFHTSFPCGMIFLWDEGRRPDAARERVEARLAFSLGDMDLGMRNGSLLSLPAALVCGGIELAEDEMLLDNIPCRKDYYRAYLRLPIDDCGVILLLAPRMPETDLPLTRVFQPVMGNFAKAIHLCRSSEAYTERIIADQRSAEAALKDMSYRYRLILDSVGEGIYGTDNDGVITFANPVAAKLLGFDIAELLQQKSHRLFHHTRADGRPYPFADCPLHRTLADGASHRGRNEVFRTKQGAVIEVEYVSTPLRENGKVIGAVVVFQDITSRRQAEESLARSEARFRRLAENARDVIYRMSLPGGAYEYMSPATTELFGYAPEEFYASPGLVRQIIHPGWRAYFDKEWSRLLTGDMPATYEFQIIHRSGDARWMNQRNILIRDADGRPVAIEGIVTDITERKLAEEELHRLKDDLEERVKERTDLLERRTEELEKANERLKELDRLKSAFLAAMSHELRTPLNSIIGFSSILHDEWLGPINAEQKNNLATIRSSGKQLLSMINDVLDVTRIETGKITPDVEEFELNDLLAEAEKEVAAAVREKGLELRSEPLCRRMRTDRQRLLQCVLNILGNAVKFTDRGSVTVTARLVSGSGETPGGETVEIAVTDTGIGLGEEELARIFQPFARIAVPEREIVPGAGLGLFLTRKIVAEILRGDILVSSEYGKGSRFSLRIPVRLP